MEIKCFLHPNSNAISLCKQCGFICADHKAEHLQTKHKIIAINHGILNLYNAIGNKNMLTEYSYFLTKTKKKILAFLEHEIIANSKLITAAQKAIEEYQAEELNLDASIVRQHIKMASSNDMVYESKNTTANQLSELFARMMKECLNNKTDEEKTIRKINENYKKYIKDDNLGISFTRVLHSKISHRRHVCI